MREVVWNFFLHHLYSPPVCTSDALIYFSQRRLDGCQGFTFAQPSYWIAIGIVALLWSCLQAPISFSVHLPTLAFAFSIRGLLLLGVIHTVTGSFFQVTSPFLLLWVILVGQE